MMDNREERKLQIELVPDSCFHLNLRYILPKKYWEIIKKDAKIRANGKCMICGRKTEKLEAHERFIYDEKSKTVILKDVVSICKPCHSATHMNFTALKGNLEVAENQYMRVNNCSFAEMKQDLLKANEDQKRRSKIDEWNIDISALNEILK